MAADELTIVILSYNVENLLSGCLDSVIRSQKKTDKWKIVVIDNASVDNSVRMVRNKFPRVRVVANKENIGFGAANNLVLKQVSGPFTLLLNPDTIVYPEVISTVLEYLKSHPDVGAATCRVELPDGRLDYSCHRRFPNPANAFIYFFTGYFRKFSGYSDNLIPQTVHEIDALCGAFAMFKTSAGKKLGWFDEDFWWNGEDLDLCFRLKRANWKIVFIPQVKITHFKGSSSGLQATGRGSAGISTRIRSMQAGISAMRIFYDKHYKSGYPAIFNFIVYTGMSLLKIVRTFKIKYLNSQV